MPEEFSAGTESATPADSQSSNVDTAISTGAGVETSSAVSNETATAADQIDPGWSFEDAPEDPAAIPDNDDDIQELVKDPALDQARTPGLVTALQTARQKERESRRQLTELRQQISQFEQFGGYEGVNQTMGLVNGLLTNPEQGTTDFLGALYQKAYPSYEHLVHSVIDANADYVVGRLQELGRIPADFTQQRAGSIDAQTLATIPEHLRSIAKNLPANVLNDLLQQPDEVRDYNLERELKLSQLDANQRYHAEKQWREQSQTAHAQGQESLQKLSNQYENAHYTELAKWKPLGPDNESSNQIVYKMAMEGAFSELLADQKFSQMYQDAYQLISNAPMRRLRNESFAADADERKGRQLGAQVNTRLGQLLRERVKLLDSVFRDARAYRESQRSEIPQRTEISGMSSQAGRNGAPPTLLPNGKTNPAYLDYIVSNLPGAGSRRG